MNRIMNIAYDSSLGFRGEGDLYFPRKPESAPIALVIHGGGWNSMDRSRLTGVAEFLAEIGFAVFNINYRLLREAPWPGCLEDCLKAADFVINAGHQAMLSMDRSRLLIVGASAGAHLALMTGLKLGDSRIRGIIAISPLTDLSEDYRNVPQRYSFFLRGDLVPNVLKKASPINTLAGALPPVLCTHSVNDKVVSASQSQKFVEAYTQAGGSAELYLYEHPAQDHGIWRGNISPHRLIPELEEQIKSFILRLYQLERLR